MALSSATAIPAVALIAINAWLVHAGAGLWQDAVGALPRSSAAMTATARPAPTDDTAFPALPDLDALDGTRARPLFTRGRRPIAAITAAPASRDAVPVAIAVSPPPLRLTGVMVIGATKRALVATESGIATWVEVGAEVGGWSLAAIAADRITVEAQGTSAEFRLYGDKAGSSVEAIASGSGTQAVLDAAVEPPAEAAAPN